MRNRLEDRQNSKNRKVVYNKLRKLKIQPSNSGRKVILRRAKWFIEKKATKPIRTQALILGVPIEEYKKVISRTLKRRVNDDTCLSESDLWELAAFIGWTLVIVKKQPSKKFDLVKGWNKSKRKKIDPLNFKELRQFLGRIPSENINKPGPENDNKPSNYNDYVEQDPWGIKTEKSVRPVKNRTMRRS